MRERQLRVDRELYDRFCAVTIAGRLGAFTAGEAMGAGSGLCQGHLGDWVYPGTGPRSTYTELYTVLCA